VVEALLIKPVLPGWRELLFLGVLLCSALFPGRSYAQEAPDTQAYTALVREALAAARRGDQIGLADAGGRLVNITAVRLPDGSLANVNNAWLRDELQRNPPNTLLIADRLGALADALAAPPPGAPADALERLRTILSNPPYGTRERQEVEPPSWLIEFLSWLGRLIEAMLRPFGVVIPGAANAVAWVIGILGLILLIGVTADLINGLRRATATTEDDADQSEEVLTSREALTQASTLARDGDRRAAVRYLYLAALLRLDEQGLLHYDRALTNREYIERVRDNPKLHENLRAIVEIFDQVWYGHLPIEADTFERYRLQVERLGREA
jgi:hypothetical protein